MTALHLSWCYANNVIIIQVSNSPTTVLKAEPRSFGCGHWMMVVLLPSHSLLFRHAQHALLMPMAFYSTCSWWDSLEAFPSRLGSVLQQRQTVPLTVCTAHCGPLSLDSPKCPLGTVQVNWWYTDICVWSDHWETHQLQWSEWDASTIQSTPGNDCTTYRWVCCWA